jgi:hypothetical protein
MIPLILIISGSFIITILTPIIHERLHLRKIRQLGGDGIITHGVPFSTMTHTKPLNSYDDYIAVTKAPIIPTFFLTFIGTTMLSVGAFSLTAKTINLILVFIILLLSIPFSIFMTVEACEGDIKKIEKLEKKKHNNYPFAVFRSCIEQAIEKTEK